MKLRRFICAVTSLAMALSVCQAAVPFSSPVAYAAGTMVVRLDPSNASPFNNGKFEGWGTSMGWWGNRIGHSDKMAQQAAADLYSENGLSLDIVRYNVGGGDNPSHTHIERSDAKMPCFAVPQYKGGTPTYDSDGKVNNFVTDENGDIVYDMVWEEDHDQLNVLTEIQKANPNVNIEGYTNSPPWFMTNSQCSSGGVDAGENLDPSNNDVFAKFLVETTNLMEEHGFTFSSYSPMNEPHPKTKWWGSGSPKQEGNHVAQGAHQSGIITAVKKAFTKAGIKALVAGMDENDIGDTISSYNQLTAEAKTALDRIDTHSYNGSNRAGVRQTAIDAKKDLWMSEVDGGWNGFRLADQIIVDLNGMQASAWVLWDIIDFHKDSNVFQYPAGSGNFPEANTSLNVTGSMWGVGMGNHDTETIEWANKYYAYGQFTRYINPGDTLIASSDKTLAAYNRETGDIKIVVNNPGSATDYEFDLSAFKTVGNKVTVIRSNNATGNAAEHWKEIENGATLDGKILKATVAAGTITTYIVSGAENFDDKYASITGGKNEINIGVSVVLTLNTNIDGKVTWAISDNTLADLTVDENDNKTATITAKSSGTVTVSATVGDLTVPRTFIIPSYKLSGTPSWGNADNAPKDSDDYRKAADGDLGTFFDGQQNGWVMYDYGAPYKVKEIQLAARSGSGMDDRTVGGKVQGSNDAIKWTDLYTITSKIPAGSYTTVTASQLSNKIPYRYYRYTNPSDMTNIAEFLIDGEYPTGDDDDNTESPAPAPSPTSDVPDDEVKQVIDTYSATENGLSYSYTLPEELEGNEDNTAYFAVYDKNGSLKYVSVDKSSDEVEGDFSDCTHKLFVWKGMEPVATFTHTDIIESEPTPEPSPESTPEPEPIVTDIAGFTDNFEGADCIFNEGSVFDSELERFGNVFAPNVGTPAVASLDEAIELNDNQLFRLQFNVFSGYLGGDTTTQFFALKDAEENELVSYSINLNNCVMKTLKIGGENVLDGEPTFQCRSNMGTSKTGANGWGASGQPYRNNMGHNITGEILIDGAGNVSVTFTGGLKNIEVKGAIGTPVSIKSIEIISNSTNSGRSTAYDNFDGDVITYGGNFDKPTPTPVPTPTPAPTPTPEPTEAPVLPEDGTLISLDFEDGLTSGSTYGKASGSPTIVDDTDRGGKVAQFSNAAANVITLTDANGNGLLAGQDEITISFSVKPTVTNPTSWWFFSAPNANAQTYQQEHYLGVLLNKDGGKFNVERYNGGGSRATANAGDITLNAWNDIVISVSESKTDLYINGTLASSVNSSFKLSDILGSNPVAYIGKANWGNGEYATGYIDNFVIKKGAIVSALDKINLGDLSAVTGNLTLPTDDGITWASSNESVISTAGVVTRQDETTTVVLTATLTENGSTSSRTFTVTVLGYTAAADTFTAYADGTTIKYTSEEIDMGDYAFRVGIGTADESGEITYSDWSDTSSGEFTGLTAGKTYKVKYVIYAELGPANSDMTKKAVIKTVEVKDKIETAAYLFAHFVGNESSADHEQIYFSISQDGTNWSLLNKKAPVLKSTVGTTGVRDPHIIRGKDGKFFIIATDLSIYELGKTQGSNKWGYSQTNGSRNIIIWESEDLVNWSEPRAVAVMPEGTGCVWAPEAVYDIENDKYMVFWASKILTDNYSTQRVYRSYTDDFVTFTEAEPYISETVSNIDTTIVEEKGVYYRFTKNESASTITMMKSNLLDGPWTPVSGYTLGNLTGYEGPTAFKTKDGKWTLMFDLYSGNKGYIPFVTDDISTGNFKESTAKFESGITYRHGSVMPITKAEYDKIMEEYGENIVVPEPDPEAVIAPMTNAGNSSTNSGIGLLIATGETGNGGTKNRAPYIQGTTASLSKELYTSRIGALEFSVDPDVDPDEIGSAVLNIHVNSINENFSNNSDWVLLAAYETDNPTLTYTVGNMDDNLYPAVNNDYTQTATFWTNEHCSRDSLGWKTMDVKRAVVNALKTQAEAAKANNTKVKIVLRLQVPSNGLNVSTAGENAPYIEIK